MALLSEISEVRDGRVITRDCSAEDSDSYKEQRTRLERLLKQAQQNGDTEEAKELQDEINELIKKGTEDSAPAMLRLKLARLKDQLNLHKPGSPEYKAIQEEMDEIKEKTKNITNDDLITELWEGIKKFIKPTDMTVDGGVVWYDDIVSNKNLAALIDLFSSDSKIKDHEVFHSLAEKLGVENPSELEEQAYALIQSFFSKGRYMNNKSQSIIDSEQLTLGDKVELEHTDNPVIARRIALDHITETPNYYTLLAKMENKTETKDVSSDKEDYAEKLFHKLWVELTVSERTEVQRHLEYDLNAQKTKDGDPLMRFRSEMAGINKELADAKKRGDQGDIKFFTEALQELKDKEKRYTKQSGRTIGDSTGAFSAGELQRLDQTLHSPLVGKNGRMKMRRIARRFSAQFAARNNGQR